MFFFLLIRVLATLTQSYADTLLNMKEKTRKRKEKEKKRKKTRKKKEKNRKK